MYSTFSPTRAPRVVGESRWVGATESRGRFERGDFLITKRFYAAFSLQLCAKRRDDIARIGTFRGQKNESSEATERRTKFVLDFVNPCLSSDDIRVAV